MKTITSPFIRKREFFSRVGDNYLMNNGYALFRLQIATSYYLLCVLVWNIVTYLKLTLLPYYIPPVYAWTNIFFHPIESNLFNYIFLCIILGILNTIAYYIIKNKHVIIKNIIDKSNYDLIKIIFLISIVSLAIIPILSVVDRIILCTVNMFLPFSYLLKAHKDT